MNPLPARAIRYPNGSSGSLGRVADAGDAERFRSDPTGPRNPPHPTGAHPTGPHPTGLHPPSTPRRRIRTLYATVVFVCAAVCALANDRRGVRVSEVTLRHEGRSRYWERFPQVSGAVLRFGIGGVTWLRPVVSARAHRGPSRLIPGPHHDPPHLPTFSHGWCHTVHTGRLSSHLSLGFVSFRDELRREWPRRPGVLTNISAVNWADVNQWGEVGRKPCLWGVVG